MAPSFVSDADGRVLQINRTALKDLTCLTRSDARQDCSIACYNTPNCVFWIPSGFIEGSCTIGTLAVDGADNACSQGLCPHGSISSILTD